MNANVHKFPSYDFTSNQLSDVQKMALVVVFQRNDREAGAGMAGWIHSLALPFNVNPGILEGPKNAERFKNKVTDLIQQVISKQQEFCGFALNKEDLRDLKLEGNGRLASAFKKVYNAMIYGGDLVALDTVSACAKFTQKARSDEEAKGRASKLREAAKAQALSEGLAEGTPEFDHRVAAIVGSLNAIETEQKAEKDPTISAPLDEVDTVLHRLSAKIHSLMADVPLEELLADLSKYEEKIEGRINYFLAKKGGLLKTGS